MNADEVSEMIDAITEGRDWTGEWRSREGADFFVSNEPEGLEFTISGISATFDDPCIAREIAGALVAWASRKQPTPGFPPFMISETLTEEKTFSPGDRITHIQYDPEAKRKIRRTGTVREPFIQGKVTTYVIDWDYPVKRLDAHSYSGALLEHENDYAEKTMDRLSLQNEGEKLFANCTPENPCGTCSMCQPFENL